MFGLNQNYYTLQMLFNGRVSLPRIKFLIFSLNGLMLIGIFECLNIDIHQVSIILRKSNCN